MIGEDTGYTGIPQDTAKIPGIGIFADISLDLSDFIC